MTTHLSTADGLRRLALALPEVEEHTHFRLPAFKLRGKVLAVLQSDRHAVLHLDRESTDAAVSKRGVEEVRRSTALIGVRVDLFALPAADLEELLRAAWRHRAPRALLREHDG